MPAAVIAICSNPDCTRHAAAPAPGEVPEACPTCGAPMLTDCWKCSAPLVDPRSSYCTQCGVPLKRVLPRRQPAPPHVLVCTNPECDWGITVVSAATVPSRCATCGSGLAAECWKCGTRITDPRQHYCGACGVPLKRQRRPA